MKERRRFSLFNKKEINKSLRNINEEMDEYAGEFYSDRKEKGNGLSH